MSGNKIIRGLEQALAHTKAGRKIKVRKIKVERIDEFHMHEAMHMASFLMAAVSKELCEHETIKVNPKWDKIADKAHSALFDLYQAIAKVHLGDKNE